MWRLKLLHVNDTQNVTLSLPKLLLKDARHVTVERGISLSRLLADTLSEAMTKDRAYDKAAARFLKRMDKGFKMGTHGRRPSSRADLYEV